MSDQAKAKAALEKYRAAAKKDADLAVLVSDATAAYRRGSYWTAWNLLSDESIAYQRSL